MTADCGGRRLWPGWRVVVPFLATAYPVTFLFFYGGEFCGPLCYEPTAGWALAGGATLLGLLVLAVAITPLLVTGGQRDTDSRLERFIPESPLVGSVLLVLFGVFVVAMVLDAGSVAEGTWKPLLIPASFAILPGVWAMYVLTFVLALPLSAAGVGTDSAITLAVRAVVLFIGFPLSVAVQALVLDELLGERADGSG